MGTPNVEKYLHIGLASSYQEFISFCSLLQYFSNIFVPCTCYLELQYMFFLNNFLFKNILKYFFYTST